MLSRYYKAHAGPASGAPFAIHSVHRPQQRDLSTYLSVGVGRRLGFTSARSIAYEHTPRSSKKQLNHLRASARSPSRGTRDDLRPVLDSSRLAWLSAGHGTPDGFRIDV